MSYKHTLAEAQQAGYNIRVCVKITSEAGKVLLIRRASKDNYGGIWEVPGGAVEAGEAIGTAAAREVFEETGLNVSSERLNYITYFDFENIETGKHTRKLVFTTSATGAVRVSHEHDTFRWMTTDEIQFLKRQSTSPTDYEIWDDHFRIATL